MDKEVRPLRQWREIRVMTMEELAEKSGLSRHTILRLEAGKHKPTARTVKGLMAALGVDPLQIAEYRRAVGLEEESRG